MNKLALFLFLALFLVYSLALYNFAFQEGRLSAAARGEPEKVVVTDRVWM